MPNCCSGLSRLRCYRRESQHAYIYLYSPTMTESSASSASSSSSSSHCCLICILFAICLTLIVMLTAVFVYYLISTDFRSSSVKPTDPCTNPTAKKRQLPDYVNINIDPCDNFYDFVCDKWIRRPKVDTFSCKQESELKWTSIRHEIHDKLMANFSGKSIANENDHISSIYRSYQLCEKQSPILLLYELEQFFTSLSQKEPYQSYLTLFNQTNTNRILLTSTISLQPNPFVKILSSSHASVITRIYRRPLPSPISIYSNLTNINQTAFKYLKKFDNDYMKILSEEKSLIKSYEQEYNQDSLIVKRILSFSNYHLCLSSLLSKKSNGLDKLVQLLNHFLHSRLQNFNTKSIDKQIRILHKITDNHTLVEHLQRLKTDLKTIEQIIYLNNNTNDTCIIDLLDELLDKRIKSDELAPFIDFYSSDNITNSFISNDWPFLIMLHDRLLKHTPTDTLVNFAFFDYYRRFIYPYYQPHIHHSHDISINHNIDHYGYTYDGTYSNLSCLIHSCFDIFNCYHPSLLNELMDNHDQTFLNTTRTIAEDLINRFRLLTEQSDNLFSIEKKQILNELNQIEIRIGHYSPPSSISLPNDLTSYIEYVQLFETMSYDKQERSYYFEPIYYPSNHVLFLPFGFLSLSKNSIEYHIMKILLKILRLNIHSNPYSIECSIKSSDDDQDSINTTKLSANDEAIAYLLLRSKFISEQKLILDEYLWPFTNANSQMRSFLIDYTANNYCKNLNGYDIFRNNTHFIDDIHLIFHCKQASSIKQSKCTVI